MLHTDTHTHTYIDTDRNTWIHRCAHTETQIDVLFILHYGWVTRPSHGGAKILYRIGHQGDLYQKFHKDIMGSTRSGKAHKSNLSHTRPHTQSRWGEASKLKYGGARILYIRIRGRRTNLNHTRPHTQSQWG